MKRILLLLVIICATIAQAQSQCSAAFTYTTTNNSVYFYTTDSLTDGSTWDFGDGSTINFGNYVSHVYNNSGSYQVRHVVIDTLRHCTDSLVKNISIQFTPGCSASFIYQIDSIYPGRYSFYDASPIVGSNYLNSQWTVNGTTVASNTQSFSYAFNQPGTYHVCEQIQTSSGCSSSTCQDIIVGNTDSCNLKASYTYTAVQSNPFAIRFSPTMDTGSNIKYSWYFGDGTYDSTKNPVHTFSKGIYYVSLTLQKTSTNTTNCSGNYSAPVYINIGAADTCSVSFTYAPNPGKQNQVSFTENSGQPIASEEWTIYKGVDSLLPSSTPLASLQTNHPTYTFPDTGRYLINLKITTEAGCINTASSEIFIDSLIPLSTAPNFATKIPAYPNPATNNVNVNVALNTNNNITINIYNATGSLVITKQIAGTTGNNQLTIPVQGLRQGIYYMEINYGNEVKRSSFQKL